MTTPSTAASDESSPMPPAMQAMIPMELLEAYVALMRACENALAASYHGDCYSIDLGQVNDIGAAMHAVGEAMRKP